jgi:3-hydroxybutyryl-CoA dehydrogenase/5-formyl-3-hydroxy-2-methylpyridine 4-carboxylate dehydrogenase
MTGDEMKSVAIVGAGTMGPGMAATFARHGFEVQLADIQDEILEKAKGMVDIVYKALIGGGFVTEAEAETGRANITYTLDVAAAVSEADFVLEAIPEKLELKHDFFREVEKLVRADTILASNTSGILITKIAEAVERPERVVGMHWSNPPHMIPVIEVIRGAKTSDATVEATRRLTERIDMIPVLVKKDVAGFVENRILYAIMREALHLLDEGVASPEDIDMIVKWGIGYKLAVIGPLELLDVAGLDIYNSVASYLNADLSASSDVSSVITEKVDKGELGIKTGGGLFDYEPGEIPALMQRRVALLMATKKVLSQ